MASAPQTTIQATSTPKNSPEAQWPAMAFCTAWTPEPVRVASLMPRSQSGISARGSHSPEKNISTKNSTAPRALAALAVKLTEATSSASGYVIAYPADGSRPATSNLNWVGGDINANLAIIPTSNDGRISIFNHGPGTLSLIVDCSGYFAA